MELTQQTSKKLWRMVMEFAKKHPDSTGKRARLDLGDMTLCAEFAEQIVRECAEVATQSDHADGISHGDGAFIAGDILRKFGLEE